MAKPTGNASLDRENIAATAREYIAEGRNIELHTRAVQEAERKMVDARNRRTQLEQILREHATSADRIINVIVAPSRLMRVPPDKSEIKFEEIDSLPPQDSKSVEEPL